MTQPTRLSLTVEPSTRRPGQVICRIGQQICFPERGVTMPAPGVTFDAIITRPLFHRVPANQPGAGMWDYNRLLALLVRPSTEEDFLLWHSGFECSGSMCSTTASVSLEHQPPGTPWPDRNALVTRFMATPGRTLIYEADNVNRRGDERLPRRPGFAFFRKVEGRLRCEGVADYTQLACARLVRR